MRLKHATLLYLLAVSYHYAMNVIGAAFPGIYQAAWLVQIVQMLSVLAGIVSIYFYIVFYLDYPQESQPRLKEAAMLAAIGTSATLLLSVRGLFLVFSGLRITAYEISPDLIGTIQSGYIATIGRVVSWGSSMLILLFFFRFYRSVPQLKTRLKSAVLFGFIAALIVAISKTSLGLIHLFVGDLRWIGELSRPLHLAITQPTTALAYLAALYFFRGFYHEQSGPPDIQLRNS